MSDKDFSHPIVGIVLTLSTCAAVLAAVFWFIIRRPGLPQAVISADATSRDPATDAAQGMVRVKAGKFLRGSDRAANNDARPAHIVRLDAFSIDTHEVTNDAFAEFVAATGYRTTAEELGFSYVFRVQDSQWEKVSDADWQHPSGPDDSLSTFGNFPVVHVSWFDAAAYAKWANKRLPTCAEWERAARGSLHDMRYPWGDEELAGGRKQANYWRAGVKPLDDARTPRLMPIGSYPPNALGLYDVAGNVWEWCYDWYAADDYQRGESENPRGPNTGTDRVARGGSWVGSAAGHDEITVHHRGHFPPAFSADHLGFRCAQD